jgi:glycosyltransferase involved in cell wall biosynthesis
MKSLIFDVRWMGEHGIGRFAREVHRRLGQVVDFDGNVPPFHPADCVYSSVRLRSDARRSSLFFSPGYNSPLYCPMPFALTVHDLAHIDFAGARTRAKSAYYALVLKPACRRAVRVFTVSEYSRARIIDWAGVDPAHVVNVGNGVDPIFSAEGASFRSGAPYVLCPGNRKPHKNELRALEAFAAVARGRALSLRFLGAPSAELLAHARKHGVAERIAFHGRMNDTQLAELYRGAELVLFPSLYEGFGLPIVESMACGTPVVTSDRAAMPDVAGGAALLVDPEDVHAMRHALRAVLDDPAKRSSLRGLGLANARRFSWEHTARKVEEGLRPYLA